MFRPTLLVMVLDTRTAYQEMLAERITPLLRTRGFAVDGDGRFRLEQPDGGAVEVQFREAPTFPGQAAFAIEVRAATGRWAAYARETGAPEAEAGQVWGRVAPPDGFGFHRGSDDWNLRSAADAPGYAAEVGRLLEGVVAGLERHLALNAALERALAEREAVAAFERPPELVGVINRMSYLGPDDAYAAWLRAGAAHAGPR
jgi:hypothetical protein